MMYFFIIEFNYFQISLGFEGFKRFTGAKINVSSPIISVKSKQSSLSLSCGIDVIMTNLKFLLVN